MTPLDMLDRRHTTPVQNLLEQNFEAGYCPNYMCKCL